MLITPPTMKLNYSLIGCEGILLCLYYSALYILRKKMIVYVKNMQKSRKRDRYIFEYTLVRGMKVIIEMTNPGINYI